MPRGTLGYGGAVTTTLTALTQKHKRTRGGPVIGINTRGVLCVCEKKSVN